MNTKGLLKATALCAFMMVNATALFALTEKEPNNAYTSADTLKMDNCYTSTFGTAGDEDWYYYKATDNGVLQVTLTGLASGFTGMIEIFDGTISKTMPVYSSKHTTNVSLNGLVQKSKWYYIRFTESSGSQVTSSFDVCFHLDLTDESHEYNNEAKWANLKSENSYFKAKIWGDDYYVKKSVIVDEDWYRIAASTDGVLEIKLDSLPTYDTGGNAYQYVIEIYDVNISTTSGNYINKSALSNGSARLSLNTLVKKGITYYVRIQENNSIQDSNLYHVNFHLDISDQGGEYNDDYKTASVKPSNSVFKAKIWGDNYYNLKAITADEDWYKVKPKNNGVFQIKLDSLPTYYSGSNPYQYYIEIYDSAISTTPGNYIHKSALSNGSASIELNLLVKVGKVYYVRIQEYYSVEDSNLYIVKFRNAYDYSEYNNDYKNAKYMYNNPTKTRLWGDDYYEYKTITNDEDWYIFRPYDNIFILNLTNLVGKDLGFEIYETTNLSTVIASDHWYASSGTKSLNLKKCLDQNKTYYLRIFSNDMDSNYFNIEIKYPVFKYYGGGYNNNGVCQGDSFLIGVDSVDGFTYSWNGGKSTASKIYVKPTTTYQYDILKISFTIASNTCYSSIDTFYSYNATPIATFSEVRTSAVTVSFTPTQYYNNYKHIWDFGDGTKDSTHRTPVHTYATGSKIYTVTLKIIEFYHGCKATWSDTLSIFTGIDYISGKSSNILIYPNPSNTGQFTLQGITETSILNIFDLNGKLLFTQHLSISDKQSMDTQLPEGMYMIEISSSNMNVRDKLIIQR